MISLSQAYSQKKDAAKQGMNELAGLESARNVQNQNIKQSRKQQQISGAMNGAMMGMQMGGPMGAVIGAGAGYLFG